MKTDINTNNPRIVMKMGKGYVAFDGVCIAFSLIMLFVCVYNIIVLGVIVFLILTIASIINFFSRKSIEIIVENNTITEKKMWKKDKKISFGEVDHLSLFDGENTEIIAIYSRKGTVIKIPRYFQNVVEFELIIEKRHWKWK